jgi:hypothetical protein
MNMNERIAVLVMCEWVLVMPILHKMGARLGFIGLVIVLHKHFSSIAGKALRRLTF